MTKKKADLKADDWVYDKRSPGRQGRVLKISKDSIKVEFIDKHPIEIKTYKKADLKNLVVDN